MKKTLMQICALLAGVLMVTPLAGCDQVEDFLPSELLDVIGGNSSSITPEENENEENEEENQPQPNEPSEPSEPSEPESPSEPNEPEEEEKEDEPTYLYNDFTPKEKALFLEYIGEVIPFAPNDEYYVEGYYEETDYENGMSFYTVGNTQADFDAYRAKFSEYTLVETYEDDDGDTWYAYDKEGAVSIYVDMSYYYHEGEYVIDVYVFSDLSSDLGGGSTDYPDWDWDDEEEGGTPDTGEDTGLLTNAGAGLPSSQNGVYEVDFTKATYVKNVTEQVYYLGGCPTMSANGKNPAVLVIPVEFSDVTAASKGYTIDKIEKAWKGDTGTTDYFSVQEYYYRSSYGKLNLDVTVWQNWFKPKNTSSYYKNQTMEYYGEQVQIGDQLIMHEALAYLEDKTDLSKYDSDGNGYIDSVVLINTLNVNSDEIFHWAYRYWNMYTESGDNLYEYDNVSANDYLWASYQFMHECYDSNGNESYTNTSGLSTYTYLHEFGHILGADDYYDTAYVGAPMDGCDIMDDMTGDHNPYTKFHYGWLTSSKLIVDESSVTLNLSSFTKTGETIIIANNWDEKLGAYQEYYIVAYYTGDGLNGDGYGYFARDGVVVYHVNASLYKETVDGETYYGVYNNNTDPSDPEGYGTEDNLIEYVKSSQGNYTYVAGDKIPATTKDDQGNKIAYTFTVNSVSSDSVSLTFTKNK